MKPPREFSLSSWRHLYLGVCTVLYTLYKPDTNATVVMDMASELKGFIAQKSKWAIVLYRKNQSAFSDLYRVSNPCWQTMSNPECENDRKD